MSALNKILKKRKESEEQPVVTAQFVATPSNANRSWNQPVNQKQLEGLDYVQMSSNNPSQFQFSTDYFPNCYQVYDKCKFPFGVFFQPYCEPLEPTDTKTDRIPRCLSCRAYMNLYNRFTANGTNFICALCNRENALMQDYVCKVEEGQRLDKYEKKQLHQPVFSSYPPDMFFTEPPPESCFVFIIDVSSASYHSQMLFYAVNVIKEVLSNPEFDDHLIFFYTFDDHVHEYQLTKQSPQRKIIDNNIDQSPAININRDLGTVRDNLWAVLDTLEDIAKGNESQKSNFYKAFSYAFEATQSYSPKIFATQTNQTFITEQIAVDKDPKAKSEPPPLKKSKLESSNGLFYSKFVAPLITKGASVSLFCFAKQYRNLKIFSDCFKLSNSQIMYYQKDSKEDALKFYYDFYNLLSTSYIQDFKIDFIVSQGWGVSATYANMYRQQKTVNCKINNLSEQKYVCLTFQMLAHHYNSPCFIFQAISSYSFRRSRRIAVSTVIKPTTNSLHNIFTHINYPTLIPINLKIGLSLLRMDESLAVRNDIIKKAAGFYMSVKSLFKDKMPTDVVAYTQAILAFLKSYHSHIEATNGTPLMDKIISERNILQTCGPDELTTYFVPYLFSISKMQESDCQNNGQEFVYPPTVPLSFNSVTSGLFIMDCSTHIYLFIGKFHDTQQLHQLFGVQKLSKDLVLTEQDIQNQNTTLSSRVLELLGQIRLRKSFGYIPLYVVKCGQGSAMEMRFYLNFCNQKYQEFKNYYMSLSEFTEMLHTQVATNFT